MACTCHTKAAVETTFRELVLLLINYLGSVKGHSHKKPEAHHFSTEYCH